jgi:hypothetical protein
VQAELDGVGKRLEPMIQTVDPEKRLITMAHRISP